MNFLFLILSISFLSTAVFSADSKLCIPEHQNKEFWINQAIIKLEDKLQTHNLVPNPHNTNYTITELYSELRDETHELNNHNLISYIYTHASFHLGRITRYPYWPKKNQLAKQDKALIFGKSLNLLLKVQAKKIAENLMLYSEDLFYQLYWPLLGEKNCGAKFMLSFIQDDHLKLFFTSEDPKEKMKNFITFEQTYLQETMYESSLIKPIVKLGTIDKMRWIPFAGKIWPNFHSWCESVRCRNTSYDLNDRISYDFFSISSEIDHILKEGLEQRWKLSQALFVNNAFLKLLK
ncbi:MAG: hypothetical protein CME62_05600 [Halobacteriovoraceae bacterium]|nr:hypothetical protein [Halobacteriovoraceae bacterium]|tara:strand:- start:1362 stop:2237 length:876 start_codon:yes stop_codon:yes gene_type:complete